MSPELKYAIVLTRDEESWMVTVPDLPGCITFGKTIEEAEAMAVEAIEGVLSVMKEDGIPVPEPSTYATMVNIA